MITRKRMLLDILQCNVMNYIMFIIVLIVIVAEVLHFYRTSKTTQQKKSILNKTLVLLFLFACVISYNAIVPLLDVAFKDVVRYKGYCISINQGIKSHNDSFTFYNHGNELNLISRNTFVPLCEYEIYYTKRSHIIVMSKELNIKFMKIYLKDKSLNKSLDKKYLKLFIIQHGYGK